MLQFQILQRQITFTEVPYFVKIYHPTSCQGPVLCGANVASTSQVRAPVMLLLPTVVY